MFYLKTTTSTTLPRYQWKWEVLDITFVWRLTTLTKIKTKIQTLDQEILERIKKWTRKLPFIIQILNADCLKD